jgi:Transposase DDE domain group 1
VRLLHSLARTRASFDDPNLVSHAGLVPVMALAQRAGLTDLVAEHVTPGGECGVNAHLKVGCLVAGMAAGADSIDDMDLLRHGAMDALFGGVRAPSTLGSHLRCYTWGNVSQLEKAGREFLAELARRAPLLPGAGTLAFIDIDSMQKRVYGHHKQGARFGHTKIQGKSLLVRGLNALAATISTPLSAPVIAATRLRGGNAASARGAASLAVQAVGTARECGCTGTIIVRLDSAYYNAGVIGAVRGQGARFSVTVPVNSSIRAAIAAIGEENWTAIRYPHAVWDDQLDCWISDAEVAETQYTAFASKKGQAVTARLIVRRVRDLNKKAGAGQDELFPVWRYHAVFTDSPFELVQAEGQHRDHAVVEQVFADVTSGPLAHLPSGVFAANAAWLSIAAMAHNLVRAAGALASLPFAKARGATIRRDLIAVAARTARHGRGHLTLHLPEGWHREQEWLNLWEAACGPPAAAA